MYSLGKLASFQTIDHLYKQVHFYNWSNIKKGKF